MFRPVLVALIVGCLSLGFLEAPAEAGALRLKEFTHGLSRPAQLANLVTGGDGKLWFSSTSQRGNRYYAAIGSVTRNGRIDESKLTARAFRNSEVQALAWGRDGHVWFTYGGFKNTGLGRVDRLHGGEDLLRGYLPHGGSSWSSRTRLAPVTLASRADEAGGPPPEVLRDLG